MKMNYLLIHEEHGRYDTYDAYETELDAKRAIMKYCEDKGIKSYYWNCYILPEDSRYEGGLHVDFGSWSEFFIIYKISQEV